MQSRPISYGRQLREKQLGLLAAGRRVVAFFCLTSFAFKRKVSLVVVIASLNATPLNYRYLTSCIDLLCRYFAHYRYLECSSRPALFPLSPLLFRPAFSIQGASKYTIYRCIYWYIVYVQFCTVIIALCRWGSPGFSFLLPPRVPRRPLKSRTPFAGFVILDVASVQFSIAILSDLKSFSSQQSILLYIS